MFFRINSRGGDLTKDVHFQDQFSKCNLYFALLSSQLAHVGKMFPHNLAIIFRNFEIMNDIVFQRDVLKAKSEKTKTAWPKNEH